MAQPVDYKEKYRVTLYTGVPFRNRAERHLVEYAQRLLAEPTHLTIHQVHEELETERARTAEAHPSWGGCRVTDVRTTGTTAGASHLVQRGFVILGRGRETYTLLISESVMKNITLNCWPVGPWPYPFGQPA